jgi:hypothetical protein
VTLFTYSQTLQNKNILLKFLSRFDEREKRKKRKKGMKKMAAKTK